MPTLLELRTQVRQRADMENSTFVSDSELNNYINQSLGELYDLLIATYDDYFVSDPPTSFTLTGGQDTYTLPADFYKLRGIDYSLDGVSYIDLNSFNFKERNVRDRLTNRISNGKRDIAYRVIGGKLYFRPSSNCAGSYRLWYIPKMTQLAANGDTTVDLLNWEQYAIVDAAIKCMAKEESDPSVLMAEKASLKERIQAMAADRDVSSPERVADVSGISVSPYDDWGF